jgi:hypothetical protein
MNGWRVVNLFAAAAGVSPFASISTMAPRWLRRLLKKAVPIKIPKRLVALYQQADKS